VKRGHRIDIITGRPFDEPERANNDSETLSVLQQKKDELDSLSVGLNSPVGEALLDQVHKLLDERIAELVAGDDQARAYMSILTSFGKVPELDRIITKRIKQIKARLAGPVLL